MKSFGFCREDYSRQRTPGCDVKMVTQNLCEEYSVTHVVV